MLKTGLLILLATLAFGCSTVAENLKDTTYYRRDIEIEVNGVKVKGAGVFPEAKEYVIRGAVKGGFDYLIVRSCHREYLAEKEGGDFKWVYRPVPGIESGRACPLEIRGAEQVKGRHSFGLIDFENTRDTLEAVVDCNGETKKYRGVSACQSAQGLIERITFDREVIVEGGTPECVIPEPKDLKTYEFKTPPKQCLFKFMEIGLMQRTHRLTTLGYAGSVVREI